MLNPFDAALWGFSCALACAVGVLIGRRFAVREAVIMARAEADRVVAQGAAMFPPEPMPHDDYKCNGRLGCRGTPIVVRVLPNRIDGTKRFCASCKDDPTYAYKAVPTSPKPN